MTALIDTLRRADAEERGDRVSVQGREYELFFVCGHPRSGTTWTRNLLVLHPRIYCHGEFRFEALRRGFDRLEEHPWHAAHHEPVRSEAERCFQDSIKRIMGAIASRRPDARWIGDRTPRALVAYLPSAPHFYVLRDGRDVLVSLAIKEIAEAGFNFRIEPFASDLGDLRRSFLDDPLLFDRQPEALFAHEGWFRHLARQWARHVGHDQDALDRVRDGGDPMRVHVVRYERLHEDLDGERAAMYEFLGLRPQDAGPTSVEDRTSAGLEGEDPRGFYRKGAVGQWRRHFTDQTQSWFKQETGDLIVRTGYEQSVDW